MYLETELLNDNEMLLYSNFQYLETVIYLFIYF